MNYLTAGTLLAVAAFTAAVFVIRQHGYVATMLYLAGAIYDHASNTRRKWEAREAEMKERWTRRMDPNAVLDEDERSMEGTLTEIRPRYRLSRVLDTEHV